MREVVTVVEQRASAGIMPVESDFELIKFDVSPPDSL
jgi:hypothetical protein